MFEFGRHSKVIKAFRAEAPILVIVPTIITVWIVIVAGLFFLDIFDLDLILVSIPALFNIMLLIWIFGLSLTLTDKEIIDEALFYRHRIKYSDIITAEIFKEAGSALMRTSYPTCRIQTEYKTVTINLRPYQRTAGHFLAKEIHSKAPNARVSQTINQIAQQP